MSPVTIDGAPAPELPPPEEPTPSEDPATWPWPFNLAQEAITDFVYWIIDSISWAQNGIETAVTDLGDDLQDGIADSTAWLRQLWVDLAAGLEQGFQDVTAEAQAAITGAITRIREDLEGFVTERIGALQQTTVDGMGGLTTLSTGLQRGVDDIIQFSQITLHGAVIGIQSSVTLEAARTQQAIDGFMGGAATITAIIQKEVGPAVIGAISAIATPGLRALNDTLEAI